MYRMDAIIELGIKEQLPFLDDKNLKAVLERLSDLGVTKKSDLSLVEVEDLKDVLKTIQARILVKHWKNAENEPKEPEELQQVVTDNKDSEKIHTSSLENMDWAYDFKVSWHRMPLELLKTLREKKRLTPSLRRNLIRIVSDDINALTSKPGRKALAIIARTIVKAYPESLSDALCGEVVGEGHTSLAKQLEVRFDNLSRSSDYNTLKRRLKEESEGNKKLKLSDSYGCINWQPAHLPENETPETQEHKKKVMIDMPSKKTLNELDHKLLSDTYFTQRSEINSKNDIAYLKKNWPLLFTKDGMLQHFEMLVGVSFDKKFEESLSQKGDRIFNFLKTLPCTKKNLKLMEKVLESCSDMDDADFLTLIQLIAIYFEEDIDKLFVGVDVAIDVEVLDLPNTPCLVYFGDDALKAKSFIVFIDKVSAFKVVDFLEAFSLLFMSFYCFNIHYPTSASTTLEFVQRCLLGINPVTSCKKNPDVKKRATVNSKILHLVNKIAEYELIDH